MTRNLLYSLMLGFLFSATASAQDWAKSMFSVTSHNFGTVARGAKSEFDFEITNKFVEDVHIASVRTSCGCTTPTITKQTLKTWEKGAVHAVFNTNSFLGSKNATITVTIDKPYFAEVQLNVSGFIRSDVVFTPGVVELGSVGFGEATEKKVDVSFTGHNTWIIKDVRSANEHIEVKLAETARGNGRVNYNMIVRLKEDAPAGYINDALTLVTNDQSAAALSLPVEGVVVSPVSVSPASLFLGVLKPGDKVTKQLVVRANKPFRITNINCSDEGFTFGDSEEMKKLHFVPVTFTAGEAAGKVAQTINIVTDLGADITCVATATVQTGP